MPAGRKPDPRALTGGIALLFIRRQCRRPARKTGRMPAGAVSARPLCDLPCSLSRGRGRHRRCRWHRPLAGRDLGTGRARRLHGHSGGFRVRLAGQGAQRSSGRCGVPHDGKGSRQRRRAAAMQGHTPLCRPAHPCAGSSQGGAIAEEGGRPAFPGRAMAEGNPWKIAAWSRAPHSVQMPLLRQQAACGRTGRSPARHGHRRPAGGGRVRVGPIPDPRPQCVPGAGKPVEGRPRIGRRGRCARFVH